MAKGKRGGSTPAQAAAATASTITAVTPLWPQFKPPLPVTDLVPETVVQDKVLVYRSFFPRSLCRDYVSFLRDLPLTTTPANPRRGFALRVNDRFQTDDATFAERLWTETGLRDAVYHPDLAHLWGGEVIGLIPTSEYTGTSRVIFSMHTAFGHRFRGPDIGFEHRARFPKLDLMVRIISSKVMPHGGNNYQFQLQVQRPLFTYDITTPDMTASVLPHWPTRAVGPEHACARNPGRSLIRLPDDDSNNVTLKITAAGKEQLIPAKTTWTLLLYLTSSSEGCEGGETVFHPYDRRVKREEVAVSPETGMLLLHKHGDDCMLHEGREVTTGEKWILRTDLCVRR